jgi:hypothetical protein
VTYITPNRKQFNKDIQKCVHYAIENDIPTVFIPKGTWELERLDIRNEKGQVAVTLVGEDTAYTMQPSTTVLRFYNTSGHAIGIHTGKGVNIRNLQLIGLNQLNYPIEKTCEPGTNFIKEGLEDSRFKPHGGIVFEPDGGNGSTDCLIDNVYIDGFVNGIAISPSGKSQNGDGIMMNRLWVHNANAAIVSGQGQTRGNEVRNIKCWNSVRTVFDCTSYGEKTGTLPTLYGANFTGVYQIFAVNNAWSTGSFNNIYAESLYRIGDAWGGELPINFNECHIDLYTLTKQYPENIATGANLNFRGGMIRYFDDAPVWRPMNFNAGTFHRRPISFRDMYMNNPPTFGNDADWDENFIIENVTFKTGGGSSPTFTQKWNEYYQSGSGTVYNDGQITFESGLTYELNQPVISRHGVVGIVDKIEGKKITLKYCIKVPEGTQVGNQLPNGAAA